MLKNLFIRENLKWKEVKMMKKVFFQFLVALTMLIVLASYSNAALIERGSWVGSYGVSQDGWGGTDNSGIISAEVPSGATVTAAYLYSGSFFTKNFSGVTLAGNPVALMEIGDTGGFLWSAVSDVTSIAGGGSSAGTCGCGKVCSCPMTGGATGFTTDASGGAGGVCCSKTGTAVLSLT